MSDSATYRIKLWNPVAILMIGLALAALGTINVLYPDAMEARTGIGRMGKRLAPVMRLRSCECDGVAVEDA